MAGWSMKGAGGQIEREGKSRNHYFNFYFQLFNRGGKMVHMQKSEVYRALSV